MCQVAANMTHTCRVSASGTEAAKWDADTWPELDRLVKHVPEAGIHHQGMTST